MRILFASQPIRSHVHSLVPVALAAQRLGHTVALASGASLEPTARRLGFDFLPCGLDHGTVRDLDTVLPPQARVALAEAPVVVRHLVAFSGGLGPPFAQDLIDRGQDCFSQAPHVFRAIIDALDGLDVNGIVTVGTDLDPADVQGKRSHALRREPPRAGEPPDRPIPTNGLPVRTRRRYLIAGRDATLSLAGVPREGGRRWKRTSPRVP